MSLFIACSNSYQHCYGCVVYMVTILLVQLLMSLQINGLLITTLLLLLEH